MLRFCFSLRECCRAAVWLSLAFLLLAGGAFPAQAQQQGPGDPPPAPPRSSEDGNAAERSQAARFRLASRYLDAGEAERAIALLENLYAEAPATLAFYQKLLDAYESQKRYGEAIALVEREMERRGRSPALLSEKARLQYHGDAGEEAAFATWDAALAAAPQSAQTYRTVYGSLTDARLFRKAIETVKQAREALGDPAAMRLQLAYLYSLTSQHEEAIGEYLALLEEGLDRLAFVKRRLGSFLDQEEALQESIAAASRAVRAEPLAAPYRELIGWLYLQAGEHEKALGAYRALDRLEDAGGRVLSSFAQQATDAGAYRTALDAYNLILERHAGTPAAPDALQGRGQMHERLAEERSNAPGEEAAEKREEHYEKALGAYRAFLDEHPEHAAYPSVLRAVGRIEQDVRFDLGAAQATLEEVVRRYPQSEAAYQARFDLGRLHVMRGDLTEARLAFSRLAERLGGSGDLAQEARYEQALLHFYQGEFDAASTLLQAIAENTDADVSNDGIGLSVLLAEHAATRDTSRQAPDAALALFAEARLKHRQREEAQTLAFLDTLLGRHARSPLADDARFFKAQALAEQGRPADAAEAYAQVALTHPRSPLADRSLYQAARLQETALARPEAALQTYRRLLTDYPGSLHTPDVRARIQALRADATSSSTP